MNIIPMTVTALIAVCSASLTAQIDREYARPVEYRKLHEASYGEILGHVIEGYRVSDIEVRYTNPTRFNGTMIKNEGAYYRNWTFYHDKTYNELALSLLQNNQRPVDIERYQVGNQVLYAALAFKNTGRAQKQWNLFRNVPQGQILATVGAVNGRAIDIEPYNTQDGWRFDVISIANTGSDAKAWWVYSSISLGGVQNHLEQHGSRVYDFEDFGYFSGTNAVILVKDDVPSTTLWNEPYHANYSEDEALMGRITSLGDKGLGYHVITFVDNLDPFEEYGTAKVGTHGVTTHSATGKAFTGTTIEFEVENLWPWAPAAFSLGLARSFFPLDIAGAPGCALYTMPVFSDSLFANGEGVAKTELPLPNMASLHGFEFQTQMYGIDPGLNALNVQTSNGLETTIRHW